MRPWIVIIALMMRGTKPGQISVTMARAGEELWMEFNELAEAFRVMVSRPELWEQGFTMSLVGMLARKERLALK